MLAAHGESVAVAVDVRDGRVSAAGWTESTEQAPDAVLRAPGRRRACARSIYTDVDRDGMLSGPDVDAVSRICSSRGAGRILYSGGIGSLADLEALAAARRSTGVIVGKALYEGRFTIVEAQAALGGAR